MCGDAGRMGKGPWDELPSLRFNRNHHGMMGFDAGRLQVIGGNHEREKSHEMGERWKEMTVGVRYPEMPTLVGGKLKEGWEVHSRLPFSSVRKACSRN